MKLLIFTLFFISFSFSHAFTLTYNSSNRGYANPKIVIRINQSSCPSGLDLRRIVSDAIEVWNGVATSKLNLTVGEDTTLTGTQFPPVAYCDSTITGTTLGQGGSAINSSNFLTSGLLRLNTNASSAGYILNQTYERIVIVAAHEIGHLIGLGHSNDSFALMHFDIGAKSELNLSQDDIDGITYLYARDEVKGDDILGGCGMIQKNPPNGPSSMISILMMLIPFLLIVWFRTSSYAWKKEELPRHHGI